MQKDMKKLLEEVLASVRRGRLTVEDFGNLASMYRYERNRANRLEKRVHELEAEIYEREAEMEDLI